MNVNHNQFIAIFKQRLLVKPVYIQEWRANVNNNDILFLYSSVKINFWNHGILENIISRNLSISWIKCIPAHNRRIQTERNSHDRVDQNLRYCLICNTIEIEDEFYFVLKSFILQMKIKERNDIKIYYTNRPSMYLSKRSDEHTCIYFNYEKLVV